MYEPNFDGDKNDFMLEIYCKDFLLMIQTDKHLKETRLQLSFKLSLTTLVSEPISCARCYLKQACYKDMRSLANEAYSLEGGVLFLPNKHIFLKCEDKHLKDIKPMKIIFPLFCANL